MPLTSYAIYGIIHPQRKIRIMTNDYQTIQELAFCLESDKKTLEGFFLDQRDADLVILYLRQYASILKSCTEMICEDMTRKLVDEIKNITGDEDGSERVKDFIAHTGILYKLSEFIIKNNH